MVFALHTIRYLVGAKKQSSPLGKPRNIYIILLSTSVPLNLKSATYLQFVRDIYYSKLGAVCKVAHRMYMVSLGLFSTKHNQNQYISIS